MDPDYEHEFDEQNVAEFGQRLARHVVSRLRSVRAKPTLRLSNIGTPCRRKLWYTINKPEEAQPLPPAARFKFLFGDILEELLLFLAKEAGHTVEGQQDELDINGVKGHRDAVIDGRTVDCKSASTYSFKKFASNGLRGDDPFGYLDQLGSYMWAAQGDPKVTEPDVGSFLVVDKTLGHITLDTYPKSEVDYSKQVEELKEIVSKEQPPERHFAPVPDGKSGNEKLCTQCSYCDFKRTCFPEIRTFMYSTGPVFLTNVAREPKVFELSKPSD